MKNLTIAVILIVIFSSIASGLQFSDCGSVVGVFSKISVSNCDITKAHCVLKRNTNATISIDFTLKEEGDVTEVKAIVHGIIMGMEVPFPLPQANGCIDSGITCPIVKGKNYEYSATLPVLKAYPKVVVEVKWQLKDSNGQDIVCVKIPAKIE